MDSDSLTRSSALALSEAAFSRRALVEGAALGVATVAIGARSVRADEATPTAVSAALVAGDTAFALDLYAALRQNADGNLLVSPFSVSQALAMVYLGAKGETATQMATTLAFSLPPSALPAAFGALDADLLTRWNAEADPATDQPARALQIANALWGEQTYPFNQAYRALLAQAFGSGLNESDFIHAPDAARGEINAWVAEHTGDHIEDIVPEGDITPDTRLVLVDAIYFSGAWDVPFSPEATQDGPFFLLDGSTVDVPFMFQGLYLYYARADGFQLLEFPYAGGGSDSDGFAFTVILPDAGTFATFEASLTVDTLNAAIDHLDIAEVLIYLPKFQFAFGAKLGQTLQSMGITDAFDPNRADFGGMVDGTPPDPLYVGEVLHKAFISVDENGTEATAATVVEVRVGAAAPVQEPPEIHLDHPFIFAIRDRGTGTLLFLGRVMSPSA